MHTVEIVLYVADQHRARDFYRAVLEAAPALDVPGMTEFDLGGCTLGLLPGGDMADLVPGIEHSEVGQRAELYLRCPDPDAALRRVEEAGGRVLSPVGPRSWGEHVGYALDHDGHVLAFARRRQGADRV